MITFIVNGELATSGNKSDSDRWRRNVGVSSDAGQAIKLRIAQLYANDREFCERQPIGVKNLSATLKRHRLECTQDRTDFRSELTVLNDLTRSVGE